MRQNSKTHYFQHFTFGLSKFIDSIFLQKRQEIVNLFLMKIDLQSSTQILDVGVSTEEHFTSNFLEKKYPYTNQITAVGIGDFQELEIIYPGLQYIKADGRDLPFQDNSFDYVYSHAVIEHTGSRKSQFKFLSEVFRVARKAVFITTPNRLHPIEFHTGIPLIHYLPHPWYRKIYGLLGKEFYSRESNLNLLTEKDVLKLIYSLPITKNQVKTYFTKFLLFKANLIFMIDK